MKGAFYFFRTLLYPVALVLVPCKVMNKDKYKKYDGGRLVISNHLSWMDVPYQLFFLPGYKRILSKNENRSKAFNRWFLSSVGTIFVDRERPELSAMRECVNELKKGGTLVVYPEGTRNRVNREILELHSGAALFALKSGSQVIPVVEHHKGKPFHRNYIGVGDPVDLSDLLGRRMDMELLNEATARFRTAFEKTLAELDVWVENKGWKTERKRKRAEKKAFKKQYKQAKKDAELAEKDDNA